MDVPRRFRWRRESDRYAAYPMGAQHSDRCIFIKNSQTGYDTNHVPHVPRHKWRWSVRWKGWFQDGGTVDGKQAAADRATERWWELVNHDPPRDVEFEAAMVVARVLVRSPPNSLFAEETPFLHKVMWHLQNVYADELRRDALPLQVKSLMGLLSEELYRRRDRTAG